MISKITEIQSYYPFTQIKEKYNTGYSTHCSHKPCLQESESKSKGQRRSKYKLNTAYSEYQQVFEERMGSNLRKHPEKNNLLLNKLSVKPFVAKAVNII